MYNTFSLHVFTVFTFSMFDMSQCQLKVVEAWIQVAMRSLAGGLAGVPLLQALGATAKAGNLPLPMGFPMKYLGGRGSGVLGRMKQMK